MDVNQCDNQPARGGHHGELEDDLDISGDTGNYGVCAVGECNYNYL